MLKAMPGNIDPEVMNKVLIPKIIRERYPDLDEAEVEEVRQQVVDDSVIKNGEIKEVGDKKFVLMAGKFVNINELSIDLIDQVNPFQKAFEILSKSVTKQVLKVIQDAIDTTRIAITGDEARILWPKINEFVKEHGGQRPDIRSHDPLERRMAEALLYIQRERREQNVHYEPRPRHASADARRGRVRAPQHAREAQCRRPPTSDSPRASRRSPTSSDSIRRRAGPQPADMTEATTRDASQGNRAAMRSRRLRLRPIDECGLLGEAPAREIVISDGAA